MEDVDFTKVTRANVYLRGHLAGVLEKKTEDHFEFRYDPAYLGDSGNPDVSRTLPRREQPWTHPALHPFFDNLITEGWLLQNAEKLFHIDQKNRFAILMATGQAPIGAVTVKAIGPDGKEIDALSVVANQAALSDMPLVPLMQPEGFDYCPSCFKAVAADQIHRPCALKMWDTGRKIRVTFDADQPSASFAKVIYGGSISGAQKKGLFRLDQKTGILSATPAGAQYIIKPPGDHPELPENEHVTMAIAGAVGLKVPPFALMRIEGLGNALVIRRFDMAPDGTPLMMEEMAQIMGMPPSGKYDSSCEKVAGAIRRHSSAAIVDLEDFFRRLVFCFLTGNGDMHLKNWALVENYKAFGTFSLAPCYDLLNTRLPIPRESIDIGLTLEGKGRKLQGSCFRAFGRHIRLSEDRIRAVFDELPLWLDVATNLVEKCALKPASKEKYLKLLHERFAVLMRT